MSSIEAAVIPVHFPVSATHVVLVVPLVEVATDPSINPIPVLLIILEFPFVLVMRTSSTLPDPIPIPQAIPEVSLIVLTIFPKELSQTIEPTLTVLPFVQIAILEVLHTLTMFHEVYESALVSIAFRVSKHPKPIRLPLPPLSDIGIALFVPPHASPMLEVIAPLALICLPVSPAVLSLSVHPALLVLSLVDTAVTKLLVPLTISQVTLPVPLIDLSAIIHHDPDTLPLIFSILTIIDSLLVLFEAEMGRAVQCGKVNFIGEVGLEVVVQLLVGVAVAIGGSHRRNVDRHFPLLFGLDVERMGQVLHFCLFH